MSSSRPSVPFLAVFAISAALVVRPNGCCSGRDRSDSLERPGDCQHDGFDGSLFHDVAERAAAGLRRFGLSIEPIPGERDCDRHHRRRADVGARQENEYSEWHGRNLAGICPLAADQPHGHRDAVAKRAVLHDRDDVYRRRPDRNQRLRRNRRGGKRECFIRCAHGHAGHDAQQLQSGGRGQRLRQSPITHTGAGQTARSPVSFAGGRHCTWVQRQTNPTPLSGLSVTHQRHGAHRRWLQSRASSKSLAWIRPLLPTSPSRRRTPAILFRPRAAWPTPSA